MEWPTVAARDWRMPNSAESQAKRNNGCSRGQQLINFVVHDWPTAMAVDGGKQSCGKRRDASLTNVARCWPTEGSTGCQDCLSGLLGLLNTLRGPGYSPTTQRLNPLFVELLMALPPGWSDCTRSATQSFRWLALSRTALSRQLSLACP